MRHPPKKPNLIVQFLIKRAKPYFLLLFLTIPFYGQARNNQYDKMVGYNSPWRFLKNYTIKFEELPLQGSLQNKPWSGDYWADFLGGTSYRWFQLPKNKSDKRNPALLGYKHQHWQS